MFYFIVRLIWWLWFRPIIIHLKISWPALSAIGTILIAFFALYPIFKEALQKKKANKMLRDLIYIDVRDLYRSFKGKLETYKDNWERNPEWTAPIPQHDFMFFHKLESNFYKAIFLTHEERVLISQVIKYFRLRTYHVERERDDVDYSIYSLNTVDKRGIEQIVRFTNLLKTHLEKVLKIESSE